MTLHRLADHRGQDSAGRTWDFAYDAGHRPDHDHRVRTRRRGGNADEPRLRRLAPPLTGVPGLEPRRRWPTRVVWNVGYDAAGKATTVVDPIAHADFADVANTFTYSAVDRRGRSSRTYSPAVRNTHHAYTFDPYGRVTTILDPGASRPPRPGMPPGTWPRSRRPITTTTSATTTYQYDGNGNVTRDPGPRRGRAPDHARHPVLVRHHHQRPPRPLGGRQRRGDEARHEVRVRRSTASSSRSSPTARAAARPPPTPRPAPAEAPRTPPRTSGHDFLYDAATGQLDARVGCPRPGDQARVRPPRQRDRGRPQLHRTARPSRPGARLHRHRDGRRPDERPLERRPSRARSRRRSACTTQTDPVGNVTTYAYDALGRLTSEVLPGERLDPRPDPDDDLRRARQRRSPRPTPGDRRRRTDDPRLRPAQPGAKRHRRRGRRRPTPRTTPPATRSARPRAG